LPLAKLEISVFQAINFFILNNLKYNFISVGFVKVIGIKSSFVFGRDIHEYKQAFQIH
jgi:hypothetical protein